MFTVKILMVCLSHVKPKIPQFTVILFKINKLGRLFIIKILLQGLQKIFGGQHVARGPQFGHVCYITIMVHLPPSKKSCGPPKKLLALNHNGSNSDTQLNYIQNLTSMIFLLFHLLMSTYDCVYQLCDIKIV